MNIAAVLAGGSGTRMRSDIPKQFLKVNGKPLIIRSILAFINNPDIDMCIVAVGRNYIDKTEELISSYINTDKKINVIEGGSSRGKTLEAVLEFMKKNNILEDNIILTHDAVRPFITDRIISENIEKAKLYGAVNTCIPAVDTMLISNDGEFIDSVPERKTMFHAQTPQSFNAGQLYDLIKATPSDIYESMTDGCSVFIYHGKKVAIVEGEGFNIKITYPDDIKRAEITAAQYFD